MVHHEGNTIQRSIWYQLIITNKLVSLMYFFFSTLYELFGYNKQIYGKILIIDSDGH